MIVVWPTPLVLYPQLIVVAVAVGDQLRCLNPQLTIPNPRIKITPKSDSCHHGLIVMCPCCDNFSWWWSITEALLQKGAMKMNRSVRK